jgi:hypothetical protein
LEFIIVGLLQIGSLFSIRRPFRLWGIILFYLTLRWQAGLGAYLCDIGGLPYERKLSIDYPILDEYSWFFPAHILMTLSTVVLHPGMLALSKGTDDAIDVSILIILTFAKGRGICTRASRG